MSATCVCCFLSRRKKKEMVNKPGFLAKKEKRKKKRGRDGYFRVDDEDRENDRVKSTLPSSFGRQTKWSLTADKAVA